MNKIKRNIFSLVAVIGVLFTIFSCADNDNAPIDSVSYYEAMDLWVESNYPDIYEHKVEDGVYMKFTKGPSVDRKLPTDSAYVKICYTSRDIDSSVIATMDERLTAELGTRSHFARYVPFQYRLSSGVGYAGITPAHNYAIKKMAVGDTVEMVVSPSAGYSPERAVAMYQGFAGSSPITGYQVTHIKMVLVDFTKFIDVDNEKIVNNYKTNSGYENWLALKSSKIFFRFKGVEALLPDSLHSDSTLMLRYTGRFAEDSFVFDTNIADTAKKYNIYDYNNPEKYESGLPFVYANIGNDSTGFSGNIEAFKYVIDKMRLGDKTTFVAMPEFCYGENGEYGKTGTLIFTESPLVFDVEIIKEGY